MTPEEIENIKKLIEEILNNEEFAIRFFCSYSKVPGKSIAAIRSHIKYYVKKVFGIDLDDATIATIIFEHFWSDGTWKVLKSYKFKSSFFYWISLIASHAVIKYLADNGFIKDNPARKPGNTRLTLKYQTPAYCKMVIDEMMKVGEIHSFLTSLYVERLTKAEMMKKYDMNDEEYEKTLKAYEKALKTVILNTENCFDDALADKCAKKTMVSSEFLTIVGQTNATDSTASPLRDVIGIGNNDADFEEKIENFAVLFAEKIFDKKEDLYIWKERFINNVSPVTLANELGRDRGYIDCKYSRLRKKFNEELRKWWNNNL